MRSVTVYSFVVLLVAVTLKVKGQGAGQGAGAVASAQPIENLFNCNRPNMDCMGENSTCVAATGTCNCDRGTELFDCSVTSSTKVTANCECQNSGVCVDEGDGPECVCTDAFFGKECKTDRVAVECATDAMTITVAPFGDTFEGIIYILDNETPDCTFSNDGNGVFKKTLKYDECGAAVESQNANGDTVKTFTALVQYDSLLLLEHDQEFLFDCTIKKSDSNVEWEVTELSSNKKERNLQKQKVSKELRPVSLSLTHALTGEPITGPQTIGTPVKMCFNFNGGSVYDSFRVEQVTAHNGLTGDRQKLFDFVTAACVSQKAGSVGKGSKKIVTDFSGDPTDKVCITFKLFRLPYSYQVAFKNTVKVCKGTGGCNTTTCDPDEFMKLGRKRRSIDDFNLDEEDDPETTFSEVNDEKGIFVWIPGQKAVPSDDYLSDDHNGNQTGFCFQNIWFIVCIVALLLVFSLGGALIVLLCLRKRKGKEMAVLEGFDNKAYNLKI